MKVRNVKVVVSNTMPVMTLVLMVLLSLLLAGWQLFEAKDLSGVQVYLPMLQAVLLLIAVILGVAFYKLKTDSLESQDVLGLTHGGSTLSFKNTEAVLGAAAGGVIRVNRSLQAEYLSEVALAPHKRLVLICCLQGYSIHTKNSTEDLLKGVLDQEVDESKLDSKLNDENDF